jgi:hypothetical protein
MVDAGGGGTGGGERKALRLIGAAAEDLRSALSLAGLGLEAVPPELGALSSLTRLDLSANRLTELPDWISDLTELEELVLRGNLLARLPPALVGLERLARLDAADNRLVEIPAGLSRLPRLSMLDLSGNGHLILPPPQVVALGSHAVLEYLRGYGNMPGDEPETLNADGHAVAAMLAGAGTNTGATADADVVDALMETRSTELAPRETARVAAAAAAPVAVRDAEDAAAARSKRAVVIGGALFTLVVAGVVALAVSAGSTGGGPVASTPTPGGQALLPLPASTGPVSPSTVLSASPDTVPATASASRSAGATASSRSGHASATAGNSAPASKAASSPAAPSFPALNTGTYTVDRTLHSDSELLLTLTTLQVSSGGRIVADVTYENVSSSNVDVSCGSTSDPAVNTLTRSDGTVFKANDDYCVDHPNLVIVIEPGAVLTSYADFSGVTGQGSSFSFSWQSGQSPSGTASQLTL